MALIPDDPKHQKALAVIVVAIGVLAAAYMYWYTPAVEELEARETRLEDLEMKNRTARAIAVRGGGDMEQQLALYERHVMQLERLIPASEEIPALITDITSAGRRVDVDIDFIGPGTEEPGPFYTKQSIDMRAIGEYHDMGQFLTSIASLPRIITPVGLDLELFADPQNVYDDLESPVLASFRIETYVLPEGGGDAPPAVVGAGQGGAQ